MEREIRRQLGLALKVYDNDGSEMFEALGQLYDFVQKDLLDDEQSRLRMVQQIGEAEPTQLRIDRHLDGAEPRYTEPRIIGLEGRSQHGGDVVARLDPERCQATRPGAVFLIELRARDIVTGGRVDQHQSARILLDQGVKQVRQ